MPDLASDPAVGPHLAARNLESLLQDGLFDLRQTREVELDVALRRPLDVRDPRAEGRGCGRLLAPHGTAEPIPVLLLERGRRVSPGNACDTAGTVGDVDGAQRRLNRPV